MVSVCYHASDPTGHVPDGRNISDYDYFFLTVLAATGCAFAASFDLLAGLAFAAAVTPGR
jgi:hypothetical protein